MGDPIQRFVLLIQIIIEICLVSIHNNKIFHFVIINISIIILPPTFLGFQSNILCLRQLYNQLLFCSSTTNSQPILIVCLESKFLMSQWVCLR